MPIAATLRSCAPSTPSTQTPDRPSTRVASHAEVGAGQDQRLLDAPHVRDDVHRVGQRTIG